MANAKRAFPHSHNYFIDKYRIDYIPLTSHGSLSIALASDAGDQAEGALIHSVGTLGTDGSGSSAIHDEVGSTGIVGYRFRELGSDVNILWPIPWDMDVKYPMDFAVVWSSDQTTTTDTLTWKVMYTELTNDSEAVTAGATALTTAIAADTNAATANAIQTTAWGTLNGGTFTFGNLVGLTVELDATSGAAPGTDILMAYYLKTRYVRRVI